VLPNAVRDGNNLHVPRPTLSGRLSSIKIFAEKVAVSDSAFDSGTKVGALMVKTKIYGEKKHLTKNRYKK